jgi:hypothetical protein
MHTAPSHKAAATTERIRPSARDAHIADLAQLLRIGEP